MASILTTLSNDILLDVLSYLSRLDLCALALVSRRFIGTAQSLLFRTIELKLQTPSEPGRSAGKGNLNKFARLVKTLSDHPHLQSFVSTLSVNVWIHPWYQRFGDHGDLLCLLPQLQSLSLQPPPSDFQLSMLLSPRIETLHLGFAHGMDRNGNAKGQDPLEIIERVFWAPHLRRLLIDGFISTPELSPLFPPSRHRTSPITDLEFRTANPEKIGCLTNILSSVKALKRFTFETHTPWETSHGTTMQISPLDLGRSIGVHASTMETLEIAASDAAEFPDTSLFGSLTRYSKLKKLAILDKLLVKVGDEASSLIDTLPPNLEELQLQFSMLRKQGKDPNRALRVNRLRQLALVKEERFSALKRVIWWCQPCECWSSDGSRYGPASDMDDLRAAFQQVGVKFEFISDPYFGATPFGGKESGHPWIEVEDYE